MKLGWEPTFLDSVDSVGLQPHRTEHKKTKAAGTITVTENALADSRDTDLRENSFREFMM
jgi:hypothetical protein